VKSNAMTNLKFSGDTIYFLRSIIILSDWNM